MEFQSCFDIIGPIMVGPSSSHTAGAVSIGKFIHEILDGTPERAQITFYQSFAQTYQGHGTDKAIIGGILGLSTDDVRIKNAIQMAEEAKLNYVFELESGECPYYDHPNTTVIKAKRKNNIVVIGGASLGGGLSKIFMINDHKLDIRLSTGDDFALLASKYKSYLTKGKGDK